VEYSIYPYNPCKEVFINLVETGLLLIKKPNSFLNNHRKVCIMTTNSIQKLKTNLQEKGDFLAYVMFVEWANSYIQGSKLNPKTKEPITNHLEPIINDSVYPLIPCIYSNLDNAKTMEWENAEPYIVVPIETIYMALDETGESNQITKEKLEDRNLEWFEGYVPQLIQSISELPYNGSSTRYAKIKTIVETFFDKFSAVIEKNKEVTGMIKKSVEDSVSHSTDYGV
jgi:hypothetical protein